ncbi:chaplin [Streptomyces sp. NPDC001833]|uniref:chaplin n=1 Tax=Streptomyces sp. NPDC001833 TaxID=3154658 RepID=UPI003332E359
MIAVAAASGAMAVAVPAWADAGANGTATGSPGVVSGNGIQLPVDLPVNVSGNSVDVVGVLNPATGNTSVNTSGDHPSPPKTSTPKPPAPPKAHHEPKAHHPAAPPARATLELSWPGSD